MVSKKRLAADPRRQQPLFVAEATQGMDEESRVVQELIFFFNETGVRNYLIDHYSKKLYPDTPCQYAGTFFLNKVDDDVMALRLDRDHHAGLPPHALDFERTLRLLAPLFVGNSPKTKTLFTLAILYNLNAIHFVSFLYDRIDRQLVCFDPGFNLYQNGSRVLIPICAETFLRLDWIATENDVILIGKCPQLHYGRRFGVQFNGKDPETVSLAADPFCQSWTLFFVLACIMFNGDWSFVRTWCEIGPLQREQFILERFFLPHVLQQAPILRRFRSKFPTPYLRAIESLYARTMMTHWIDPAQSQNAPLLLQSGGQSQQQQKPPSRSTGRRGRTTLPRHHQKKNQ